MQHFLYLQLFAHDVMGVAEYGEECIVDRQQGEEALHVVVDQWGLRVTKKDCYPINVPTMKEFPYHTVSSCEQFIWSRTNIGKK